MQNQQMAAMANMNAGGPVTGTPIMSNGQRRAPRPDQRNELNTYIYDYMLRNNHHQVAQAMLKCDMKIKTQKASPSGRNTNGVDGMDQDLKDDLPAPELPQGSSSDNSFLQDWWLQFWDIFSASRGGNNKGVQYTSHVRNITHMSNENRNQRMMMANGMNGMNQNQYNMMRLQQNGGPNDLKRAMHQRNPNQVAAMANMSQMQKQQAMMGAQMQRDGSQMDGRQSPGSNDNAPSPNKRPRVDGGMNQGNGPTQFNEFGPNQQKSIEGMTAGHQGSPMPQPSSLDGSEQMFAGNPPRNGLNNGQSGPPPGNHALQDYQMQLMLLEQQNKKRLLMAKQEQDSMSGGPHAQGVGGPGGFPAAMSPQGSRAGPSPNPADMKKNTPRMGPQGLPGAGGSPMPEGMMHPQRNSPAPNMQFDPNAPPQGFPQQYPGLPGQMPTTTMMRPNPSSHPQFPGQQMNQQQMEAMRQNGMQNGWRGAPGQPGMMPGQQQMGPMGGQPQQRGQMPPPPAPAGEQPRVQVPSPSQPAPAPPTPSQSNKANPKKKGTKDNKKPANKKGANTGATPAASGAEEPPTPTTPMHSKFQPNGQQQPPQAAAQQQPPTTQQQQPPGPMDNGNTPFGNINDDTNFELNLGFGDDTSGLDQFDFESFLHVGDDTNTFGGLDFGTGFDPVEADIN